MKHSFGEFQIPQDLPVAELERIRSNIDEAIRERREQEKRVAVQRMKDVAIEHGFQVGDLIPILKVKPERPARYRHPTQPELTWCGRGRRPLWMSRALKEGISLSDMTV